MYRSTDGKAPKFTQKPSIKQEGSTLLMSCALEAKPGPQIRWFREKTEIKAGGRITILTTKDPSGADLYNVVLKIQVCTHDSQIDFLFRSVHMTLE